MVDNRLRWYDLFSRGARDWLRHNEKVKDAVKKHFSTLIRDTNIDKNDGEKNAKVPVRIMEHYRFKLNEGEEKRGIGQGGDGKVKPGDKIRDAQGKEKGEEGGNAPGITEFVLEFKMNELIDWLWEELELPNLKRKEGPDEELD